MIPEHAMMNAALTDSERCFLGLIWSFCQSGGCCFATNRYLAEKSGKSERQVRNYVHKLQLLKLIVIEIEQNRFRKIWTAESYAIRDILKPLHDNDVKQHIQEISKVEMDCHLGGNGLPPIVLEKKTKKDKKEKISLKRDTKEPQEDGLSFGNFVHLSKEAYDRVVSKFGEGMVKDIIEDINLYCPNSRPSGYLDYEAAICKWCKKKLNEQKEFQAKQKPFSKETKRDEIDRRLNEEYVKNNGSFNDRPTIREFS